MNDRTKRLILLGGACAAAAAIAALSPSTLSAKPINAATTESGVGCLVADADGTYYLDGSCSWHQVIKRDKDGNLQSFSYQDHGRLPADAPRPSSARQNPVSVNLGGGRVCTGTEVTTPSGQYKSDCHF